MSIQAEDIADLIAEMRGAYAALSILPVLINQPDFSDYLLAHGMDEGTTLRLGRKLGGYYEGLDLHESLRSAAGMLLSIECNSA